jgi:trk system potassium uptake protein TrkH
LKKQHSVECFGRRLDDDVVRNAVTIVALYLFFFFMASVLIGGVRRSSFKAAMFEAASAIGTVGLSLGITPHLAALRG